jgi:hypothetical protein
MSSFSPLKDNKKEEEEEEEEEVALRDLKLVLGDSFSDDNDLRDLLKSHNNDTNAAANFAFERILQGLPFLLLLLLPASLVKCDCQTCSWLVGLPLLNERKKVTESQNNGCPSPKKKQKTAVTPAVTTTSTGGGGGGGDVPFFKRAGKDSVKLEKHSPKKPKEKKIIIEALEDDHGMSMVEFPKSIGDMMVIGHSLISGFGTVQVGDPLTFERITQKIVATCQSISLSLSL